MTQTQVNRPATPTPRPAPELETGDRLPRAEFERRYSAMPHVKKAELVEGVVYMTSPVSDRHSSAHSDAQGILFYYRVHTPGVRGGDNGTLRLDLDNEPQPDAFLRIDEKHGGQSRVDQDDYIEGAPELIIEVALSSASYDLHDKMNAYRRNGVREYIAWRVADEDIDWFILREGRYVRLEPVDGILKSEVFPGLWLDRNALLAGDLAKVLAVLQQGLADPAHAAFVQKLAAAAK